MTAEHGRLRESNERGVPWRKWGPYLRDCARPRLGGRGDSEAYVAVTRRRLRSWAYECSEDGPAGICDDQMRLCFAVALRSGSDGTLQERLQAMPVVPSRNSAQADNLPTHSYLRANYRYVQSEPRLPSRQDSRFDIAVEYAKAAPEEILIQIEIKNAGSATAALQVLPQLWFRQDGCGAPDPRAAITRAVRTHAVPCLVARDPTMGAYHLHCDRAPAFMFGAGHGSEARGGGTRAAAHYLLIVAPRAVQRIRLVLSANTPTLSKSALDTLFASLAQYRRDANEFFAVVTYACVTPECANDVRRGLCEMLWNKAVWVSTVTGWLYDQRVDRIQHGGTYEPASFRLKVAQVIASPRKRDCPHLESPAWLLHTLALTCVDAELAVHQLKLLLKGGLRTRGERLSAVHCEWQALKPWAALLMYRLQRPRRPRDAREDLLENFEVLSAQTTAGAWLAVRAQSMLEIALELASHNPDYEQRAMECYLRFVAAIAAIDYEASLAEAGCGQDDAELGARLVVSDRMQFQVASGLGLVALTGAVATCSGKLSGLARFCEQVRTIHREHIDRVSRSDHVRSVLASAFAVAGRSAWSNLAACMLLIRALLQIEASYGRSIRVCDPVQGGSMLTPGELAHRIVQQHVAARVPATGRGRLIDFCEYIYAHGAANAGQHTGWAGCVAPMICAAWSYSPFDHTGLETSATAQHAQVGELVKASTPNLTLIRR